MAYGKPMRRPYRSSRPHYRRSTKKAVPVPKKRVQFKRRNALAINKMSRDIRYLKMRSHGTIQKNLQITRNPFVPRTTRPVLVDVCNLQCFNPINPTVGTGPDFYQFDPTTTPPTLNNVSAFTIQNFQDNPYWQCNYDTVDTGTYRPVCVHLTFRLQCLPSVVDQRFRIQIFSLKPKAIVSTSNQANSRVMPDGLRWLDNMAFPTENRLNRDFFNVYYDKWVYFSSANNLVNPPGSVFEPINPTRPGGAVTGNSRIVKLTIRPKKARTQLFTQPVVAPLDPTPQPDSGSFGVLNVPQDQCCWALLSSSVGEESSNVISCQIQRHCTWRDMVGSSQVAV